MISRRPANIRKLKIHKALSLIVEKLPAGPMISPKPGPTFESAVKTPVKAEVKSRPVVSKSAVPITRQNI